MRCKREQTQTHLWFGSLSDPVLELLVLEGDLLAGSLERHARDGRHHTSYSKGYIVQYIAMYGFTTAFAALPLVTLARWRPPIAAICSQTVT